METSEYDLDTGERLPLETPEDRKARLKDEWWGKCQSFGIPARYAEATLQDFPDAADDILKNLNSDRWIYAQGPTGTGKTHLLCGACRSAYIATKRVQFEFAPALLAKIKRTFGYDDDMEDLVDEYKNVQFLAIDDLGAEKPTEWALEIFTRIINHRYNEQKLTIVSSNISIQKMTTRMERVASRIFEKAFVIPLTKVRPERGGKSK